MTPVLKSFWNALENTVKYHQKSDDAVILDDTKFESFKALAMDLYDSIKKAYMKPSVEALDRHKLAAVMIVATIECEVVGYSKPLTDEDIFMGNEMFSTEVALAWMLDSMNEKLRNVGYQNQISEYYMPEAFACTTPYFEIFSRGLYYAKNNYKLNPLEISERLFLLEFMTLLKNDVNPELLREW